MALPTMSRRDLLATGTAGLALAGLPRAAAAASGPLITKKIPSSGEALPVIGIGTAIVFDIAGNTEQQAERRKVLQAMIAGGAKLIDTAPSYGAAEEVLGGLLDGLPGRDKLFIATKVRVAGREDTIREMQQSQKRLRTTKFDLMQIHNVRDQKTDLALLREWKSQGVCRYTGITTSFDRDYGEIAQVLKREKPDFFQVNYSLGDREAEEQLLPLAADSGAAVLTNLPFGRNALFGKVKGKPLPDFAKEFDAETWAQFFLKFLISHPAVNCVIPGTDKVAYMEDNMNAGRGRLPDAAMRKRMVQYWDSL